MHSLINYISIQINNIIFGTEMHTQKINGGKGYPDVVLISEKIEIIIEMKYNGNIMKALEQAKNYSTPIKKERKIKLVMAININKDKQVESKHDIIFNN